MEATITTRTSTRRILVAEDSALVAMDIELMLQELGWEVVGPVARLDAALRLAEAEPLDGAIIDVELQDGSAFPVADLLIGRGIPFAFATGFTDDHFFATPYSERPRLQKPFDSETVREVVNGFGKSATQPRSPG